MKMQRPVKFDCNVSKLVRMMEKDQINYEGAVQRGDVWDKKRKSRLIRSLLLERTIGMLNFNKIGDNAYEALDGKQRSNAIYEYIKGRFTLHSSFEPVLDDDGNEAPIAKRKFENLPKDLQNRITSYGLEIRCYDNLTQEEKEDIFEDINNGKPVTAAEITRVKVKSRAVFERLADHEGINSALSSSNRRKKIGEDLAGQMWMMCYSDSDSLLNKDVKPVLASVEVTEKQEQELVKVLDYLVTLLARAGSDKKLARKMKSKTHIVSLAYMAFLAINKGISDEEFTDKAVKFFTCEGTKATVSTEYNGAIEGGAKPEQVRIRKAEVEKALA